MVSVCCKMNKAVILCFVLAVALFRVEGKVFSRCELAKALLAQGFPRNLLENWVCLVESESSRNTAAKGGPNSDGSYDWGLYQINDRYWCKVGHAGGDCNIDCNRLIDDNITDDSKCAKIIYKRHGFTAWNGWKSKCQGALPDLSGCGLPKTEF